MCIHMFIPLPGSFTIQQQLQYNTVIGGSLGGATTSDLPSDTEVTQNNTSVLT